MNEIKIKTFAKQFVDLAEHLQDGDVINANTRSISFLAGEKNVGFRDSDADAFQELSSKFYQECGWGDKYSEQYVSELLQKILADIYASNTTVTAEASLTKQLAIYKAYQKRHFVFVALAGITLHVPAFKLGRVKIMQPSEQDLLLRLGRNMAMNPGKYIFETLKGKVLAEFEAVAEPIRAKEMAVEESRRALEVLRYAIPFIYQAGYKDLGLNVSIAGDLPHDDSLTFVMPSADDRSMTVTWEHRRPAIPLHINSESLATLNECGAMAVGAFLEKPVASLTEIERILLRGLHWFGNALCHGEAENELLSLTTCLETFLTPRDGNPIGTAIAEGVAFLLGDSLEERKRLKKRVKELYGKRSAVSHGGEKAVLDSDLVELREFAKRLIQKVIALRASVTSQKALMELIEDSKFR
jgi:hypothetical protein